MSTALIIGALASGRSHCWRAQPLFLFWFRQEFARHSSSAGASHQFPDLYQILKLRVDFPAIRRQADALREHGADVVVRDLDELLDAA